MATEQTLISGDDPIEKLYRNASKKLDVGDINNFKRLLAGKETRQAIYDDLVSAYGSGVRTKIGNNVKEFSSIIDGAGGGFSQSKNNFITRFKYWWTNYFITCLTEIKWVIFG